MNHFRVSDLMLAIAPLLSSTVLGADKAEALPVATASEAAAAFFAALKAGDVDRAAAMTVPMKEGIPRDAVREYYLRISAFIKRAGVPQIVAHLRLEETSVVIFREGGPGKERTIDLDPAYLVRQEGKWLVVFQLTEFDRPYHSFDDATMRDFAKLQEWYKSQKPVLKEVLKGGA